MTRNDALKAGSIAAVKFFEGRKASDWAGESGGWRKLTIAVATAMGFTVAGTDREGLIGQSAETHLKGAFPNRTYWPSKKPEVWSASHATMLASGDYLAAIVLNACEFASTLPSAAAVAFKAPTFATASK